MAISENAREVLSRRYLIRDEQGRPTETVDGLFHRVASAIAKADRTYDPHCDLERTEREFYDMMVNLEFLPNSPTLMNAGRPLGQLSACFVLPVGDSMEEIFDAIKHAALIHKSGGGTGFSFSRLRSKGATVNSTGGVASGPVSFMKVFNAATEAVKQGGTRRGANMGILRVDHPDIEEFISCKSDTHEITNFNISVGLTQAFMEALESGGEYDLIDPATHGVAARRSAPEIFQKIVHSAWQTGEPGILFLDRLNADNPVPSAGEIESTNPCGEQPLLPYEACNLGSINLVAHLKETDGGWVLDEPKLRSTVDKAVHFLDNVIDVNRYPLPQIDQMTRSTRKIGLGVMGFADMLLYLGIPYDSEEGVAMAEKVMDLVNAQGHDMSARLAETRGAFPLFPQSVLDPSRPLRNATVTTIAPTGTLSILAGVSSGVEPVFAFAFIRNIMDGTHMVEQNPVLKAALEKEGLYSPQLMDEIAQAGTLAHLEEIPDRLKRVFVCAHDISPVWHVKMQAAFQKYTDNAVSKTVNFTHDAAEADVDQVYRLAYQLGCKGITIYRDGSRQDQVLNIGAVNGEETPDAPSYGRLLPRPRSSDAMGYTEKVRIGCGNLYITVNYDEHGICEVFTNTGRAGGCPSQSEATARLTSVSIRSGVDPREIISQLKGIRCPSCLRQKDVPVTSCPDAIARAMEKVMRAVESGHSPATANLAVAQPPVPMTAAQLKQAKFCPECGSPLEHEGGCVTCRNCGYSKCG